ncbi:MAG: protein-glutamate O-methyltransferase CheR [Candidatus Krumholzibacteriota bacterium]|nr:protein-glutamate O-methyltransferase CheR [Candidatus Krumholzibacteriota bacterium]
MSTRKSVLDISELTSHISSHYGIDLSVYRSSCMKRRVMHRIVMVGCENIEDYFFYLDKHPDEIERLKDIVTIHVTGFFRDQDVFRKLQMDIFPELIKRKSEEGSEVIRIWSAGCSTGEEAYSFAILLDHLLQKRSEKYDLEVFGTDVSEDSIRTAREGLYSEEKITRVPNHMKSSGFEPDGDRFRISNRIRKYVKFRVHDLFSPSPYSMLDLIVCRNVLIHFEHDIRGQIISRFHSALCDEGMLILGKSEALEMDSEYMFEMVVPRSKILKKKLTGKSQLPVTNQTPGGEK